MRSYRRNLASKIDVAMFGSKVVIYEGFSSLEYFRCFVFLFSRLTSYKDHNLPHRLCNIGNIFVIFVVSKSNQEIFSELDMSAYGPDTGSAVFWLHSFSRVAKCLKAKRARVYSICVIFPLHRKKTGRK